MMSSKQTIESKLQSEIDNMKDAKNAKNGFKSGMSAGVNGAGDTFRRNNR